MEKDFNLLVSRNARYYLYGNQMFDVKNSTTYDLRESTLSQIVEMIGDNLNLKYEEGEILFEDVSKFTRQVAYKIFGCFEKNKEMNLMMEYEVKFGSNLLIESKLFNQKKTLQESWEFLHETVISEFEVPQWMKNVGNSISNTAGKIWDKTKEVGSSISNTAGKIWDKTKEKATQLGSWAKEKVGQATTYLISKGIPTVMEGIRAVMFSWGGAIVSTILAVIPGLNLLNIVAWGALLLWDVMEAINGRANWMYIIIDIIGIVFSGGMAKGLMTAIGKIFGSVAGLVGKGLSYVVGLIGKTAIGRTLFKGIGTIVGGLGKVLKLAADAVAWLGKTFGFKSFSSIPGKITGFFDKIVAAFKGTAGTSTIKNTTQQASKPGVISKIASKKLGTSTVGATSKNAAIAGGITIGATALGADRGGTRDYSIFGTNQALKQQENMKALDDLGPSEIEVA